VRRAMGCRARCDLVGAPSLAGSVRGALSGASSVARFQERQLSDDSTSSGRAGLWVQRLRHGRPVFQYEPQ
jgi:hypothetical protein